MSFYQLKQNINSTRREWEPLVDEKRTLQLVLMPDTRVKRIFVGEEGVVSYVEDYDGSPNSYVTVLQDIPDNEHDHGEKLYLKNNLFATKGTEYSISSCNGYANLDGPHFFVESFIYDFSDDYGGNPRILGIEEGDIVLYDPIEFPLEKSRGYISGLAKPHWLEDAKEKTPYIIEVGKNTKLHYWSNTIDQWTEREFDEDELVDLIKEVKVIACTDKELLNEITIFIDQFSNRSGPSNITPKENKSKKDRLPHKSEVIDLMKEIEEIDLKREGLGEYAKYYYRNLPTRISSLINEEGSEVDSSNGEVQRQHEILKRSSLNQSSFGLVLNEIASWEEYDKNKARIFLTHTIPSFVSSIEIDQSASQKDSLNTTLQTLTQQVGKGEINILSPACPPYDYCRERSGNIKHMSGRLLPTIGERFYIAASNIKETYQPLINLGVKINFELLTYTGETGNLSDLVDLGVDVQEYYKGSEHKIFEALKATKDDAENQADTHLRNHGVNVKITSIEKTMGSLIGHFVDLYKTRFPDNLHDIGLKHAEIGNWLKEYFGVDEGWLMFYEQEERKYRKKQEHALGGRNVREPIIISALEEGLLYMLLIKYSERNNQLIWDLETTDNYMLGTLRHVKHQNPAPVVMGKAYDPIHPNAKYNVRQPFNTPINL